MGTHVRTIRVCDWPECEVTDDDGALIYPARVAFGEHRGRFPKFRIIDLCVEHWDSTADLWKHFAAVGETVE